jgi:peptidyl-prolyl cis-trans isomerase A (cyclophilin A)
MAALLLLFLVPVSACAASAPAVRIVTEFGVIEAELYASQAPASVANFLHYVEAGAYTGGQFHRTVKKNPDNQPNNPVKIEVIQGGINPNLPEGRRPPVALERTRDTGLKHLDGTLSLARAGPDTATSDFFICLGAQPELDFGGRRNPDGQGFAAFGRVTKGLHLVQKIQTSPTDGQKLTPPIRILKIERLHDLHPPPTLPHPPRSVHRRTHAERDHGLPAIDRTPPAGPVARRGLKQTRRVRRP